jgi:hypothetical protein
MALYLPIRTTGAFTGIGAVYADHFLSGSMILCRYLATALKEMADQCLGFWTVPQTEA